MASSRRTIIAGFAGIALAGASAGLLTACKSGVAPDGNKTETLDTASLLAFTTSVDAGLVKIVSSAAVVSVIGDANAKSVVSVINKIMSVESEIASAIGDSVSIEIGTNWVKAVLADAGVAIGILLDFSTKLPATAVTLLSAVQELLPYISALVGLVAVRSRSAAPPMSAKQAQAIIAAA